MPHFRSFNWDPDDHERAPPADAVPDAGGDLFLYHPAAGPAGVVPPGDAGRMRDAVAWGDLDGDARAVREWLLAAGFAAVRVHLDGGNDERFAEFRSAADAAGRTWDKRAVADRAAAVGVAGVWAAQNPYTRGGPGAADPWTPAMHAADRLDAFAHELSGPGVYGYSWGIGEYTLFGDVTVDLATGGVTDHPDDSRGSWRRDYPPRRV